MPAFDRDKWNAKYAAGEAPGVPSAVLLELERFLPTCGKALDVAGGAGRHAIWLAKRGLTTTLADVSDVGLKLAAERAAAAGVSIETRWGDLETGAFPAGPWDLIVSVCYLHRPLFPKMADALAPGGVLVVIQPTMRNLERHTRPPAPFLLEPGELPTLADDLEILHSVEDWSADGRHDAVLVGRRRASS